MVTQTVFLDGIRGHGNFPLRTCLERNRRTHDRPAWSFPGRTRFESRPPNPAHEQCAIRPPAPSRRTAARLGILAARVADQDGRFVLRLMMGSAGERNGAYGSVGAGITSVRDDVSRSSGPGFRGPIAESDLISIFIPCLTSSWQVCCHKSTMERVPESELAAARDQGP